MKRESGKVALCGMMAALGTLMMLLGGVIPVMTFCSPALAGLALLPPLVEYGNRWALCTYAAIAALSLMIAPDRESALLFAFLGYYPVLKVWLDHIRRRPLRILAKLAVFNLAAGAVLLCMAFLFPMDAALNEYADMTRAALIAFAAIANLTMLLYDRMLAVMARVYYKKLRRLFHK